MQAMKPVKSTSALDELAANFNKRRVDQRTADLGLFLIL